MMKNIYTIAGTLLLLGAVLSCTREKALEPEQAGQMRFAVTVEGDTKASMTSADLGQFYLKVTGPNNAFSFFDTIVKEGETWKASSKRLLWKDEESSITYAAASYGALGADYFNIPVTNDLFTSGATMGLLTDQGTQEKLNAADLLTMKETTLAFADTDDGIVPVTLKHGLAKANFKLTLAPEYFDNGVGLEASPITGLALSGVHTSFFFSPLTGEVSIPDGASKGAVIPFQSSYEPGTEAAKPALAVAEAILVPEAFAAGALTLYFTVAGKDFTWTNSTPLTFEQGGEYEIPVSVAYVAAPVTPDPGDPVLDGALSGKFSVSDTKKVYFSKGNLQAKIASYSSNVATASEWKFADSQYSCIGNAAGNNSFAADSWVDLFCWVGASADKNTYGLITFTSSSQANHGNVSDESLKTDWGTAAASSIGSGWRTLSSAEWEYLFGTNSSNKRTTTSGLYFAKATVNSVLGVILLPDDWSTSYYTLSSANSKNAAFTVNQISSSDWSSKLESHGCVFLPAAGRRIGSLVDVVGWGGVYWSSSAFNAGNAYCVDFYSDGVYPAIGGVRYDGFSVRLVHDVAAADPATDPTVIDLSQLSAATTADIGKVVGADGKIYANVAAAKAASTTACAIIAYVGSATGEASPYNHGLAIAMKDAAAGSTVKWSSSFNDESLTNFENVNPAVTTAQSGLSNSQTSGFDDESNYPAFYAALHNTITTSDGISAAAPASGTSGWFLPSLYQWNKIVQGLCGKTADLSTSPNDDYKAINLYAKIVTSGGDGLAFDYSYWSSTEYDGNSVWFFNAGSSLDTFRGNVNYDGKFGFRYVRSVLAF